MADKTVSKRVRTGPSSYLNLNDADYKAWKAAGNKEYGDDAAPADQEADAQPEAKAVEQPQENKARSAPAEKKGR